MRGNTAPSGKTPAARRRNPVRDGTPFYLRLCLVVVAYGISAACRASMDELQASSQTRFVPDPPSPRPRGRPSLATLGCAARSCQLAGPAIRARPLRRGYCPRSCDLTFRPTRDSSIA